MSLLVAQQRYGDDRHLGRVAELYDDVRVRVEQEATVRAAQECLGQNCATCEGSSGIELLLELAVASGAAELPVEDVVGCHSWCELVLVSFDATAGELGI